ncbi:MAG: hypothetical protein JEZ12_09195 [Desulfobacterium sp.]|nr:hypothetical protein [Desulfobacterium sp.]
MNQKGIFLVELTMALAILGIALVPMIAALDTGVFPVGLQADRAIFVNQARATLNRVAGLDFSLLDANQGDPANLVALFGSAAEAAKENFVLRGSTIAPVVAVTDASGGTGGLVEIRATVGDLTLAVLKAAD